MKNLKDSPLSFKSDGKNLFFASVPVPEVDLETFEIVKSSDPYAFFWYGKDRHHVYFFRDYPGSTKGPVIKKIKSAAPETLNNLSESESLPFARDRDSVYYAGRKLKNVDAATFKNIGRYYYIDAKSVFYINKIIPNEDPSRFLYVAEDLATGPENLYSRGIIFNEYKGNTRDDSLKDFIAKHKHLKNYWFSS